MYFLVIEINHLRYNMNNLITHLSNHVSRMIRTSRIGLACNLVFHRNQYFFLFPVIRFIPQSVTSVIGKLR